MHHFIFPTADSWITSGSKYGGVSSSNAQQKFGQDEILEVKKEFVDGTLQYYSRALVQFKGSDLTDISASTGTVSVNASGYITVTNATNANTINLNNVGGMVGEDIIITDAKSEKINEIGAIIKDASKSAPALNDKLETVCGDLLVIIDPVA